MYLRTSVSWVSLVALLISSCASDRREVSRAPIPGSDLTVVLYEDFKRSHLYRVLEDGVPVSELRDIGRNNSETTPSPTVTSSANVVTIAWRDTYTDHFVRIDVAARRIVADNNLMNKAVDLSPAS